MLAAIILGVLVGHLRELGALGRIVANAFLYFLALSTLALIVGLVVADLFRLGLGLHINPTPLDSSKIADYAAKAHDQSLVGFLLAIIPLTLLGRRPKERSSRAGP